MASQTQSIQYNIEDYRTLLNYMFNCLEREDLSNILSLSTSKKKTKRKTIESEIFQNHYINVVHTFVILVVFSLCIFQMFSDGEKERNSQYWRLEDPENVFFFPDPEANLLLTHFTDNHLTTGKVMRIRKRI